MIDRAIRRRLAPAFDAVAAGLGQRGLQAGVLTGLGLLLGVAACVCAALAWWPPALVLWLLNRLLDGLDGPLARRSEPTALGGLLDFSADFVIYSGFVVAIAIARPPAQLACVALLATYLVNNVVLLSFSSIVERLHLSLGDERSLRFTTGLAEGGETIVVYALFCLFPGSATEIAWVFAAVVALTAIQRVAQAVQVLSGR